MVLQLGESAIAFQVKVETLEQSCDPKDTITAPLDCFDLVVQTFHESTTEPVRKVVDYFIQPVIERRQELVEAGQPTAADFVCPLEQSLLGFLYGQLHLEYGREFLTEGVGQFQFGRMLELATDPFPFVSGQVSVVLANNPHHAFDGLLVLCFWQYLLETAAFLFAHVINALTVVLGYMVPVHHHFDGGFRMGCGEFLHRIGVPLPHICAGRFHRWPQASGNGLQKLPDGFLFAVWQNGQKRHVAVSLLRGHEGDEILPSFGQ